MIEKSDVTIVGAGIVGLTCAIAMAQAGITVAIVDMAFPEQSCIDTSPNCLANSFIAWVFAFPSTGAAVILNLS